MAEQRYAEERINQQATGRQLKRRGILAAAGAVVAGLVAKQAAQPVTATSGTGGQGALVLASNTIDNTANIATRPTYLLNTTGGTPIIGSFFAGDAFVAASIGGAGLVGRSTTGVGVDGVSGQFHGVIGQTGTSSGHAGVAGFGAGTSTIGVLGDGGGGGGSTVGAVGIQGQNAQFGVVGKVSNVPNTIAVHGLNSSTGANGIGVLGQSTNGYGVQGQSTTTIGVFGATNGSGQVAGVYGVSNASYGVIGFTTAAGYSGVTAITGTAGVAALAATSTIPSAYAAYFTGTTVVQGNFVAFGGSKSAAVPDASGQHRLVYCVESPEAWFEDFGTGTLTNGKAEVTLDPVYTQIAHTDAYHVFLTEYGAHNDLYVEGQTARGFLIRAKSDAGSSRFSWRVVAKRRDITGERLAMFAMPKINHPDPSQLPTPPGVPRKP